MSGATLRERFSSRHGSKTVFIPDGRVNRRTTTESWEDACRRLGFTPVSSRFERNRKEPCHLTDWNSSPVRDGGYHSVSFCGTPPAIHQRRASMSEEDQGASRSFVTINNQPKTCAFCKSNRETFSVYSSHWLKDERGRVTCPVLRRYSCRVCGATGDDAHTDSYCPVKAPARNMKALLTTAKSSTGVRSRSDHWFN